ncbi:MAG: hypothetical protein ACYCTZ_12235 [Candidatus Dormibacteria bacterium]
MRGVEADTNRETGMIKVADIERIRWTGFGEPLSKGWRRSFRGLRGLPGVLAELGLG